MKTSLRWIGGSALMMVLAVSPLAAQRMPPMMRGGPPDQGNRQQLEQRIRARFGEMIRQRLGLDDETAKALNQAVEAFQQDRGQLARDQEALRKRVEAFSLEGGGSDQEAQQLLARMAELRQRESRLYQSEQDSLRKVLSPSQLLRFDVMREQMAQRIQQLRMGGAMMGRGRGPGRGGPGDGASGASGGSGGSGGPPGGSGGGFHRGGAPDWLPFGLP